MRGLAGIVLAAAALAAAGSAPAAPQLPAQKAALEALRSAVAHGQVDRATAARGRAEIDRAAGLIRRLPSGRREHVEKALEAVAAFRGRLTKPRTVALIGQLKANDDYFARHWAPADRTDIHDADGVVYRYFSGQCFEFHPLAEFVWLNARVTAKDPGGAERLARALIERGVPLHGGGLGWEYYFAFGGGRPPWLSGMAQAMATQAFARTAAIVPDAAPTLMRAAHEAYRAIPGRLVTRVAAGQWIKLYGFDRTPVLNAQLQSVISLGAYATRADDTRAADLAASLQAAAVAMLPRFDTGYWTYYALPRDLSPVLYQDYVVQLLKMLASADPRFADAAARFAAYRRQPPAFKLATGGLGELRFWLSKPATVRITSPAGPGRTLALRDGWHTFGWKQPPRSGTYRIKVSAVDWVGNRSSFEALPIVQTVGRPGAQTFGAATGSKAPRLPLSIGAGLDSPDQARLVQRLGLRLARMTVAWPVGAGAPDPSVVTALRMLPTRLQTIVELTTPTVPADDADRAPLALYAASLAQQTDTLRTLVLAPAPTAATAADYAATFDAVRQAVAAVRPDVAVVPLIDGAAVPKSTVAAFAQALAPGAEEPRAVAFRPAAEVVPGMWTAADVPRLVSALAQAFGGTAPPVLIDGVAVPTSGPGAVPPAEQGRAYAAVLSAAACSTSVTGVILDRVVDSTTTATGVYSVTGAGKPSASLVAATAAPAQRGTLICPGLASTAAPSTLTFPTELDPSSTVAVHLACVRDCLYLITLDDARGLPVSARRGAIRGGGSPLTLGLPNVRLKGARYRLDVRLVDRVNPGQVARWTSALLPVNRS